MKNPTPMTILVIREFPVSVKNNLTLNFGLCNPIWLIQYGVCHKMDEKNKNRMFLNASKIKSNSHPATPKTQK